MKTDANQNQRPVKPDGRAAARIDGAVALLMALGCAQNREDTGSVYEHRGLLSL